MIIFTLRRILLLIVTLFLLTFVGFSLSYFTPHAPLQGASLWNAWVFWFNGLIHWDFGVSSINGQPIAEQLKGVFPATMELCILAFGFALIVGIHADSYSWTVNEEYSSSKRWAGTVKLVLYNLRSTENVAVEKVCLTYGYTTKRAEGSGSTSDEYDVS